MALALPAHGRIVGTEIDPTRAEQAYAFHRRAGQEGKLEILVGPILETLPGLEAGSFDLAFIDAAKSEYLRYLEHALRLVRPGGLIVVDNLARISAGPVAQPPPGVPDLAALQEFNHAFVAHPRLLATILPFGDGIGVAVVRAGLKVAQR
jgi:predicted O-methyltransferase YrrM